MARVGGVDCAGCAASGETGRVSGARTRTSSTPLAILLPPSEGKAEGGVGGPWDPADGVFGESLGVWREQLAERLARIGGGDEKLLGVGGKHLLRAQASNSSLLGSPSRPAWQRYTGVVWDHLSVSTLSPRARSLASSSVAVISGLLGVVAIDDPTPDYRLKMGASLAPFGKLSTWWRPDLTEALDEWLEGRFVVDLLPNEHRAAWEPDIDRFAGFVSVTFVEQDGSKKGAVVGHDAKAAKGMLARHLLETLSSGCSGSWLGQRWSQRWPPTATPASPSPSPPDCDTQTCPATSSETVSRS